MISGKHLSEKYNVPMDDIELMVFRGYIKPIYNESIKSTFWKFDERKFIRAYGKYLMELAMKSEEVQNLNLADDIEKEWRPHFRKEIARLSRMEI